MNIESKYNVIQLEINELPLNWLTWAHVTWIHWWCKARRGCFWSTVWVLCVRVCVQGSLRSQADSCVVVRFLWIQLPACLDSRSSPEEFPWGEGQRASIVSLPSPWIRRIACIRITCSLYECGGRPLRERPGWLRSASLWQTDWHRSRSSVWYTTIHGGVLVSP